MNEQAYQSFVDKAAKKAEGQDSFIKRNFMVWILVAYIIYPLVTVFSAITEGGHIYTRANDTFGSPGLALVIMFVLVIVLESSKYLLKLAVDDLQASVFTKGGADLAGFFVKVIWGGAALIISVILSVKGSEKISEDWREQKTQTAVQLISVDSIQAAYDARIKPYQDNVKRYGRNTWKGVVTAQSMTAINKQSGTIDKLETERAKAVEAAQLENEKRLAEYQQETSENAGYAKGFTGIAEAMILFCLIFIGIYDDGVRREATNKGN